MSRHLKETVETTQLVEQMANVVQPQQHKGSSRDSLGWGHEGMRKGQTHIHRHTERLRLGDRSRSSSEAQRVHYI